MAATRLDFTSEAVSEAMLEGLTSRIREALKARIVERITPDIDAAVDAALASFKTTIEGFHSAPFNESVIRVLIEKKEPPNRQG